MQQPKLISVSGAWWQSNASQYATAIDIICLKTVNIFWWKCFINFRSKYIWNLMWTPHALTGAEGRSDKQTISIKVCMQYTLWSMSYVSNQYQDKQIISLTIAMYAINTSISWGTLWHHHSCADHMHLITVRLYFIQPSLFMLATPTFIVIKTISLSDHHLGIQALKCRSFTNHSSWFGCQWFITLATYWLHCDVTIVHVRFISPLSISFVKISTEITTDLHPQVNILKYYLILWQFTPEEIMAVIKTRWAHFCDWFVLVIMYC